MRNTCLAKRFAARLCLLTLLCSCYSTSAVRPSSVRALGGALDDGASVETLRQGRVPLDAQASVRIRLDILRTDWISAADLSVSDEAMFFEKGISAGDITKVTVRNLADDDVERLKQSAPPEGHLALETDPLGPTYRLEAATSELLPWVSRFVVGQKQRDATTGIWLVEQKPSSFVDQRSATARSHSLSFDHLKAPVTAAQRPFLAEGSPWNEVVSMDVIHLDPVIIGLSIPFFPIALLFANEAGRHLPLRSSGMPKELWSEADSPHRPLFTWQGTRRAYVKAIVSLDGGASYGGDFFTTAMVGVRLMSFLECSLLARRLSASAGSFEAERSSTTLLGGEMGLHLDADGDPRFAFYFGVEALSKTNGVGMGSLVLAPRFGSRSGFFLALPLGVTSVSGKTSLYLAAQLGFAY